MPNDLLQGEYVEALVVTRGTVDTYVGGRRVPGSTVTVPITGTVRPLSPVEVAVLDLGERVKAVIQIYTESPVFTANESARTPADLVAWNGSTYQVHSSRHRTQIAGLEHWDVIAFRSEGT